MDRFLGRSLLLGLAKAKIRAAPQFLWLVGKRPPLWDPGETPNDMKESGDSTTMKIRSDEHGVQPMKLEDLTQRNLDLQMNIGLILVLLMVPGIDPSEFDPWPLKI